MIQWITSETAHAIHQRQLAEHGGKDGIREETLLASALARPRQVHSYRETADLADLASSLALGLARNLPFIDGNKRTAHVCYRVFLDLNCVELDATDEEMYVRMLALAEGNLKEAAFAKWLRSRIAN